jgi:hypothetical protein
VFSGMQPAQALKVQIGIGNWRPGGDHAVR